MRVDYQGVAEVAGVSCELLHACCVQPVQWAVRSNRYSGRGKRSFLQNPDKPSNTGIGLKEKADFPEELKKEFEDYSFISVTKLEVWHGEPWAMVT